MTPCESWPTRLAPTIWRMTSAASSSGVPAAINRARPISSSRSAWSFGIAFLRRWYDGGGWRRLFGGVPAQMRFAGAPQRILIHRLEPRVLDEFLVLGGHRRRRDLDHQPVFDPELDDVKERVLARHAAAESLGAPALARADRRHRRLVDRHRQEQVKRPARRRR